MILLKTSYDLEGRYLGKTIYDERGIPLIVEGAKLRKGILDGLLSHHVEYIYIKDDRTEDINIDDIIPIELRLDSVNQIKETFEGIKKDTSKASSIIARDTGKFKDIVKNITNELLGNKKALNLMSTVKAYDDYIFTHSLNVMIYSTQVALNKGLSTAMVEKLGMGALLHDVGKLMIPIEILNKPGKLTNSEYEIVKDHAETGFEVLRKQSEISLISAHCAYQHHERIDGSGYPRGIKESSIHEFAKIMGICDVFDAVTSDRVYRKPMLPHEAMELIYAGSGTQFDIDYVNLFKKSIAIYPEGMGVKLSNGMSGVVVKYDANFTARPLVRLLKDQYGNRLLNPTDIDLSKDLSTMITGSDLLL